MYININAFHVYFIDRSAIYWYSNSEQMSRQSLQVVTCVGGTKFVPFDNCPRNTLIAFVYGTYILFVKSNCMVNKKIIFMSILCYLQNILITVDIL